MKVSSIRLNAFATNSSSVHTPVIISDKTEEEYFCGLFDFCDDFFLKTEENKRNYMASLLYSALGKMPDGMKLPIIKDWTGVTLQKSIIDCNAPKNLPKTWGTNCIDKEFFCELLNWVLSPNIGILSFRDENGFPKSIKSKGISWIHQACNLGDESWVSRKDPKGFWSLFSTVTGTRLRVSFDDTVDMSKSTYPELVDLKITNACDKGCSYCYQNSTPKGKHAQHLGDIIYTLENLRVFEVAIGGGEPTSHPNFWTFVREIHANGMKPNFSTRNLKWCESPGLVKIFKDCCGAFAYSVDSRFDIETLGRVLVKYDLYDNDVYGHNWATVQYVVGPTTTQKDLVDMAKECVKWRVPLTLLGFKNVGRAKDIKFSPPEIDWMELLEMGVELEVDTCIAEMYSRSLNNANVKKWSINIQEGAHSMYIDAVTKTMGASSYCPKMEKLNLNKIAEKFAKY